MTIRANSSGIKPPRVLRVATVFYCLCSLGMGVVFFRTFLAAATVPWAHELITWAGLALFGLTPGAMVVLSFMRPATGTLSYPPREMPLSRWMYTNLDTGARISQKKIFEYATAKVVCWRDARPLFMLTLGAVGMVGYILVYIGVSGAFRLSF